MRWDYEQCNNLCKGLGIDFREVKVHLGWAAGYAKGIGRGDCLFCYGAANEFERHDLEHVVLSIKPEEEEPSGQESNADVLEVPLQDLNVDLLEQYCSPAPYGDLLNESTQVDPSVRRALEARFKLEKPADVIRRARDKWDLRNSKILFESKVRAAVIEKLCFNQRVHLEPYKLNIYGPGDFFRPHVDTPVDPELFIGTAVVCLPSEFTGGELVVTHGSTTQTFNFATRSGEKKLFQFAAFFGDCPHEIKPVTSGRRVTLTYHILRVREPALTDQNFDETAYTDYAFPLQSDNSRQETVRDQFKAELRTLSSLGLPYVGFLLQHEYTQSGAVKEGLKGSDRMFYELLTREGWPCRFVPILLVSKWDRDFLDHECVVEVLSFTNEDYKFLTEERDNQPALGYKVKIPFMWYNEDNYGRLLQNLETGERFLGNSSVPGKELKIYLQAAMIVDLRPVKAAGGPVTVANKEDEEEDEGIWWEYWSGDDDPLEEESDEHFFKTSAWRESFK
ncbi:hypothetical protein KFL_004440060 [Klebsormidium nitens]|uniref:Fe2OG dioxygenase domain-containing protein n=1 Tax=Klebsormidium nitens TaxID=105231 RepID=A0A1Y1IKI4_KLENI|nr:hypothetical protein KFL_004440060 [Klebsormidium nitens]|eukprot:GAQ88608.1 hypothetical protein KFL_004440060 [Klebsormidium nitens]